MGVTRIACAQLAPTLGDVEGNIARSAAAVTAAVSAGAEIVVLPELVVSGYMFADADEARAAALPAGAPALAPWIAAAAEAVVVGGFCELGEDGRLYNSAVLIDRGAIAVTYRKTHLWDREKLIFSPGERMPPVIATRYGAIALMICYDLEFSEVTRSVALDGADLIAAPVNWPDWPHPDGERPGEVITAMSAARTNHVAIAICDRAGEERGESWAQATAIIDANGWVIAAAGSGVGTAVADLDLAASRDKRLTEYVDLFADRRTDLY